MAGRDDELLRLISDVVHQRLDSSLNFFLSLPVITERIEGDEDSERHQLELITFIVSWCVLSDGFATRVLCSHLHLLWPQGCTDHVFEPLPLLIGRIFEELGTYVLPQALEFADWLLKRLPDGKFINDKLALQLFGMSKVSPMLNVQAAVISFIARFAQKLDEGNIAKLAKMMQQAMSTKCLMLKLAVIDSFVNVYEFAGNKRAELCDVVIRKSLSSNEPLILTHLLGPITHIGFRDSRMFTDEVMKEAGGWRRQIALCGYCEEIIIQYPAFEEELFKMAWDSVSHDIRCFALRALADIVYRIDNEKKLILVCKAAMQVKKKPDVWEAGFRLLRKMVKHRTSWAKEFQPFVKQMATTRSPRLITQMMKGLMPYLDLTDPEKEIAEFCISFGLRHQEWRVVVETLKGVTKMARNTANHVLLKQFVSEIAERLADPVVSLRHSVAKYLAKMVKLCGWEIWGDIQGQMKAALEDGGSEEAIPTIADLLAELARKSPPPEVTEEIAALLNGINE